MWKVGLEIIQQPILHDKRNRIEIMEYGEDGAWKLTERLNSEKAFIITYGAVYFFNFLFCYYICIGFIFDQ